MERLPPLRLLVAFDAIARTGTMNAAAGALNVTRPAVTQALRQLEAHVGTPLMDRGRKPARPTQAGRTLAAALADGLGAIERGIAEARAEAGLGATSVTVSCTLGMATHWLMPRLAEFYVAHPEVMVNVQAPPTDMPVVAGEVDVALRYGTGGWTDGETAELFREAVRPVGAPALISRLAAAGLAGAPLIHVRGPAGGGWAGWSDYLRLAGVAPPGGARLVFDNYVQAVQAALDGRGLMLGWHSITGRLVAQGALACLDGAPLDLGTGYYSTAAPGAARRAPVRAFLGWLEAVRSRG